MAKILTKPRKSPFQDRARATVDALLAATARVLVKDGYDHASTNRIAAAAGVSIGSLYQYFPSKEALVAALIDAHVSDMLTVLRETLVRVVDEPPAVAVRETIRSVVRAHGIDPRLHRAIAEGVPKAGKRASVHDVERAAATSLLPYLVARKSELLPARAANLELTVFVLVQSVEGVVHAAIIGDLPFQEDDLVAELTDLSLFYLTGRPAPSA
jgi:AcrR family transcriptional regulator